jgi:class 3 adenylate cyclase
MAAGHGGQILLAESTAGLLSGVDLVDLGPRRLRDLPTAVGVFQVRAAPEGSQLFDGERGLG